MHSLAYQMLSSVKLFHMPGVPLPDQGCSAFLQNCSLLLLQGKVPAAKPKVVNAEGVTEVSGDSSLLILDGDEEESPKVKSVVRTAAHQQNCTHKGNMRLPLPGEMTMHEQQVSMAAGH